MTDIKSPPYTLPPPPQGCFAHRFVFFGNPRIGSSRVVLCWDRRESSSEQFEGSSRVVPRVIRESFFEKFVWDRRESFFVSVVFHNMDMDQSSHIFAISGSSPYSTLNPSQQTAMVVIPYHTTASAHLQRVTFTALDGAGFQRSSYGTHEVPRTGVAGHTVVITPLTDSDCCRPASL